MAEATHPTPHRAVRIAPGMRALYRATRAGDAHGAAAGPDPRDSVGPEAETTAPSAPPFAPVRLRRDGARPLTFRGAPLLRRDQPAGRGGMRFHFALYLAEDGGVVANAAARPENPDAAAEVHLARRLTEADGLDGLLDAFEPERALPVPAAAPPDRAERFADARFAIRQDFEAFSASLRRLAPPVDRRIRT